MRTSSILFTLAISRMEGQCVFAASPPPRRCCGGGYKGNKVVSRWKGYRIHPDHVPPLSHLTQNKGGHESDATPNSFSHSGFHETVHLLLRLLHQPLVHGGERRPRSLVKAIIESVDILVCDQNTQYWYHVSVYPIRGEVWRVPLTIWTGDAVSLSSIISDWPPPICCWANIRGLSPIPPYRPKCTPTLLPSILMIESTIRCLNSFICNKEEPPRYAYSYAKHRSKGFEGRTSLMRYLVFSNLLSRLRRSNTPVRFMDMVSGVS